MHVTPPVMPEGCPWSGYTPPNVDWCEAELCSWVSNPANTWSNLAYIILGIVMWRTARRLGSRTLSMFGPASMTVGAFSLIYHASVTYFLQFFDFVGMFVFTMLVVTVNFRRLGVIPARKQLWFYVGGVVVSSALVPPLFAVGFPIQALVAALILVVLVQEARLWRTGAHGLFALALALFAAGGVCSFLDVSRTLCDPHDHVFQGHAVWHVLTAASLYALFRFYTQFDLDGDRPPA